MSLFWVVFRLCGLLVVVRRSWVLSFFVVCVLGGDFLECRYWCAVDFWRVVSCAEQIVRFGLEGCVLCVYWYFCETTRRIQKFLSDLAWTTYPLTVFHWRILGFCIPETLSLLSLATETVRSAFLHVFYIYLYVYNLR